MPRAPSLCSTVCSSSHGLHRPSRNLCPLRCVPPPPGLVPGTSWMTGQIQVGSEPVQAGPAKSRHSGKVHPNGRGTTSLKTRLLYPGTDCVFWRARG